MVISVQKTANGSPKMSQNGCGKTFSSRTNGKKVAAFKGLTKKNQKLCPSTYTGTKKPADVDEGERSSASSTDSSTHSSNSAASKLTKIGQRLRDSCRNLRAKHASGSGHCPEDYTSIHAHNESQRSKHYVPMDFSGNEGRIVDYSDLPGNCPTKEGYTYFRRKCMSTNVKNLLTETQDSIHLSQPWFHKNVGRDLSQKILATHATDGLFMVRNSSVAGGFVISYYSGNKTHHAQALPDVVDNRVTYSLDDGRTRFFDLLQMVEFYQLNRGKLSHRLTHYVINVDTAIAMGYDVKSKSAPQPPAKVKTEEPALPEAEKKLEAAPRVASSPELTKNEISQINLSPSDSGGSASIASSDTSSVPTVNISPSEKPHDPEEVDGSNKAHSSVDGVTNGNHGSTTDVLGQNNNNTKTEPVNEVDPNNAAHNQD